VSTVLVTGASSALGQRLIDSLLPAHRLMATVHHTPVNARGGRVELLAGGLERCADHAAKIAAADVIVHLAAQTHSRDASHFEHVNHTLTQRLLGVVRPGQRLIFMSTICAHPEGGAYGVSKLRAEEAVRASDLDWAIVRPAEIYGLDAGEGIDHLITFARRIGLVPDFREGVSVRYAPVAAARVVGFLVEMVGRFARSRATYTLCAERTCTAGDIAKALRRAGARVLCVPVPLSLLRTALRLHLPVPFVADQLERLVVPKTYDVNAARADFAFESGDFLRDLATRGNG
jgi:nucleoside-diphosphate-sugar epimerase